MNLYKIAVKPISAYCSPLQSDTLFGAFCWSYLYKYGEDALKKLIQNYKSGNPDIIFSNAFPCDRLPMPIGLDDLLKEQKMLPTKKKRYQKYIDDKSRKKLSTISLNNFNRLINGNFQNVHIESDLNSEERMIPGQEWRNMVNRETDVVENIDGQGSLFEVEQFFTNGVFDIYIYSSFNESELKTVLTEMFRFGIGAQRSVGKGGFSMIGEVELFDQFELPPKPNAFVALSNFVPAYNDPTDGYYKSFVKYPKVSYTNSEEDSPFKKPIIFLRAGSVFRTNTVKNFYGSCIENVAVKRGRISNDIIIGAYTIAVPCYLAG